MKMVVILFLIIIIYALGSALRYLVKEGRNPEVRVVKALTWRIGLSLVLFSILLIAYHFGWLVPHGISS